jgi:hypothetical protein
MSLEDQLISAQLENARLELELEIARKQLQELQNVIKAFQAVLCNA